MAALNYTQVLWEVGPYTLGPGETGDVGVIYNTGETIQVFLTLDATTALNVPFTIQDTILVVNGPDGDVPPTDTTCFITVTNGDNNDTVEFFLVAVTYYT